MTYFRPITLCPNRAGAPKRMSDPCLIYGSLLSWWRYQMETFSALLAICSGNSPAPGEFPTQRPVTRSFDVFFDLRLNTRLRKQSRGWWFETLPRPLWCHCNSMGDDTIITTRTQLNLFFRHCMSHAMMYPWAAFAHYRFFLRKIHQLIVLKKVH